MLWQKLAKKLEEKCSHTITENELMVATTTGALLLPGLYDSVVGWAKNSISLPLQSQGVLKFWKKIKSFSRNAISLESGIITCYGNNSKTIRYLKSILK